VKLRDFPLLTDENLDPDVVAHLRRLGFHVLDIVESGLQGSTEVDLLRLGASQGRVVVSHDADFGRRGRAQPAGLISQHPPALTPFTSRLVPPARPTRF
jgi:predicted nuclease of predicted toxin-antitoxin system